MHSGSFVDEVTHFQKVRNGAFFFFYGRGHSFRPTVCYWIASALHAFTKQQMSQLKAIEHMEWLVDDATLSVYVSVCVWERGIFQTVGKDVITHQEKWCSVGLLEDLYIVFYKLGSDVCVFVCVSAHVIMWSESDVRGLGKVGVHYLNHCSLFSVWLLYCFLLFDNELLCTYCVVSSFTAFGWVLVC